MRKTVFLAALLAFYSGLSAQDRNDSAYFDLARIHLRKDFTQSIRIKGADLEKFPAGSLSEALEMWLQGAYTTAGSLVYVVDGNPVDDVNAYSIHDIEEIYLIQNALGQVNGAPGERQLLVITTKRKSGNKNGITAAGQTYLVHKRMNGLGNTSGNGAYHQYYLSARGSGENLSYGGSASYLRDIMPALKSSGPKPKTPLNFDRLRLNGYASLRLGARNRINGRVNFTPQMTNQEQTFRSEFSLANVWTNKLLEGNQALWTTSLQWVSDLSKNLTNSLEASYKHLGKNLEEHSVTQSMPVSVSQQPFYNSTDENFDFKAHDLLFADRLTFHKKVNNWEIEPSLHLSYQQFRNEASRRGRFTDNTQTPGNVYNAAFWHRDRYFMVAPSVGISYKNSFNLLGGIQQPLSKAVKEAYPYLTASLDVVRIWKQEAGTSLKLYASYSDGNYLYGNYYTLDGLFQASVHSYVPMPSTGYFSEISTYPYLSRSTSSLVQTGAGLSLPGNRVLFSYVLGKNNYSAVLERNLPFSSGFSRYFINAEIKSTTHRLSVQATVLETTKAKWTAILHANKISDSISLDNYQSGVSFQSDNNRAFPTWTGGWINRLRFNKLSLGADVLYLFRGEKQMAATNQHTDNHSLMLQNFYVGYQVPGINNLPLEIYFSSRNGIQSKEPMLEDYRRFYGAGFKMAL